MRATYKAERRELEAPGARRNGVEMTRRLTMADKVERFRVRLHDRQWRHYGALLVAGKLIGVARAPGRRPCLQPRGHRAAPCSERTRRSRAATSSIPINTVWTLIAAFLVFGMQVGFTMLEAGFCRSRETVNVLMECIVDTCLCGLLFYAWGFAFMFSHGNGFIGTELVLPAGRAGDLRERPASRSWRSGSSSSRSPTPARRSPRAR